MLHGCDISKWQGENFDMRTQDFVIAKASEGKTHIDKYFYHFIDKAILQGKCIGAYHYARPENNTPREEARHFVNVVKPYIGNILLALDWEGNALNYGIEWALTWLREVKDLTGVKALLYCSASYIPKCEKIAINGNGIWVAKWSNTAPIVKPTFSVMAIWQYTNTPYDKDKFFGDAEAWKKYCKTDKKIESNEGNFNCGCTLCNDFKEFLEEHGYIDSRA